MSAPARAAAGTLVVVLAACYFQLTTAKTVRGEFERIAAFSDLITEVRASVARSPHPDLYAPGSRFGFRLAPGINPAAGPTIMFSLRYAVAPAALSADPDADLLVVFLPVPAEAPAFEAANRLRRVDALAGTVHVYRRERN